MNDTAQPSTPALQQGRAAPPPVTFGGHDISITINGATARPIIFSFHTPGAERAVAPHPQPSEPASQLIPQAPAPQAPAPQTIQLTGSHMAGVGLRSAAQNATPCTAIVLNHLLQHQGVQRDINEKTLPLYESVDQAMKEAFSPMMQSIDPAVFAQATQVVHQMMGHLLTGGLILSVPTDEIMAVRDAMIDHALMHVKNGAGKAFNANNLRNSLYSHPAVLDFKEIHHSSKSHRTSIQITPQSSVASRTQIAHRVTHDGTINERAPGQMISAE